MIRGEIKMHIDERELDLKPIGEAIKIARESRGMTQAQLAQIVDRGERSIQNLENHGTYPRLSVFYKIMTMFNIRVDQYFFPDDESATSNLRKDIDVMLNTLTEKELTVIQGAINGVLKARKVED